jgi:hypothetical protein
VEEEEEEEEEEGERFNQRYIGISWHARAHARVHLPPARHPQCPAHSGHHLA